MSEPRLLSNEELASISIDNAQGRIPGDIHRLMDHISAQNAVLETARMKLANARDEIDVLRTGLRVAEQERDDALATAERTAGALGEERAIRKEAERERDHHKQSAETWRKRVEQAADALADVLPGEVGRLDLVARIQALKIEAGRLDAHAGLANEEVDRLRSELARLKSSGQVAEDVKVVRERLSRLIGAPHPADEAVYEALWRVAARAQGYKEATSERDEANTALALVAHERDRLRDYAKHIETCRDAAVADNAALLEQLQDLRKRVEWVREAADGAAGRRELWVNEQDVLRACASTDAMLVWPHHGAALLKELEALREACGTAGEDVPPGFYAWPTPAYARRVVKELVALLASFAVGEEGIKDVVTRLLKEHQEFKRLAAHGLKDRHGWLCDMAGGPYPESPSECADPLCVDWASALEGQP